MGSYFKKVTVAIKLSSQFLPCCDSSVFWWLCTLKYETTLLESKTNPSWCKCKTSVRTTQDLCYRLGWGDGKGFLESGSFPPNLKVQNPCPEKHDGTLHFETAKPVFDVPLLEFKFFFTIYFAFFQKKVRILNLGPSSRKELPLGNTKFWWRKVLILKPFFRKTIFCENPEHWCSISNFFTKIRRRTLFV